MSGIIRVDLYHNVDVNIIRVEAVDLLSPERPLVTQTHLPLCIFTLLNLFRALDILIGVFGGLEVRRWTCD